MVEDPSTGVMEVLKSCRCCLQRAPHRELKTPYTHLHKTETYADMLKECFDIHLALVSECGICEVCISRLTDASEFKLQVQRSQMELQMRLETALHAMGKTSFVELKKSDKDVDDSVIQISDEELSDIDNDKYESDDANSEDGLTSVIQEDLEPAVPESLEPGRPVASRVRRQLAMTCRVRLERLRPDNLPHQCRICHQAFHREAGLTTHMRLHTERRDTRYDNAKVSNNIISCDNCGKRFRSKILLIRHIQAEKCAKCKICSKIFTSRQVMNLHLSIHSGVKPYSCKVCDKKFRLFSSFRYHQVHTHPGPDKNHSTQTRTINIVKSFICHICDKIFATAQSLDEHTRNKRCVKCKICSKGFSDRSALNLHQSLHTGVKPFTCELCDRKFRLKYVLKQHKIRVHKEKFSVRSYSSTKLQKSDVRTDKKRFACNICSKVFAYKPWLIKHILKKKCVSNEINEKTSKQPPKSEIQHKNINHPIKPYNCESCKQQFMYRIQLDKHTCSQTSPNPDAEKRFQCKICPKQFVYKKHLVEHRLLHKELNLRPYTCDVCPKKFRRIHHLDQHKWTHKGVKPYACEICDRQFLYRSLLDSHIYARHVY